MLMGIWNVWWKLERVAHAARNIRRRFGNEFAKMENDALIFSWDPKTVDMSWCSKYTVQELQFFLDIPTEIRLDTLIRAMLDLDPTDVELSFMLGQLCFHYVGKRFQGEILQVSEKFQEILANDLHDYYNNQLKQPHYIKRLSQMMKINNQIQKEVYLNKAKTDLAIVFDIFCVEISHPELFVDMSK